MTDDGVVRLPNELTERVMNTLCEARVHIRAQLVDAGLGNEDPSLIDEAVARATEHLFGEYVALARRFGPEHDLIGREILDTPEDR